MKDDPRLAVLVPTWTNDIKEKLFPSNWPITDKMETIFIFPSSFVWIVEQPSYPNHLLWLHFLCAPHIALLSSFLANVGMTRIQLIWSAGWIICFSDKGWVLTSNTVRTFIYCKYPSNILKVICSRKKICHSCLSWLTICKLPLSNPVSFHLLTKPICSEGPSQKHLVTSLALPSSTSVTGETVTSSATLLRLSLSD